MPIIKALLVISEHEAVPEGMAQGIASAAAQVFGSAPGRVWVTVQHLPAGSYAENSVASPPNPVFIEVLHADLSASDVLASEAKALAEAIAACLGRSPELVHIEYAAPGRGRVAFGGKLLR